MTLFTTLTLAALVVLCALAANRYHNIAKIYFAQSKRTLVLQDAIIARVVEIMDTVRNDGHVEAANVMNAMIKDAAALTRIANRIQAQRS